MLESRSFSESRCYYTILGTHLLIYKMRPLCTFPEGMFKAFITWCS